MKRLARWTAWSVTLLLLLSIAPARSALATDVPKDPPKKEEPKDPPKKQEPDKQEPKEKPKDPPPKAEKHCHKYICRYRTECDNGFCVEFPIFCETCD